MSLNLRQATPPSQRACGDRTSCCAVLVVVVVILGAGSVKSHVVWGQGFLTIDCREAESCMVTVAFDEISLSHVFSLDANRDGYFALDEYEKLLLRLENYLASTLMISRDDDTRWKAVKSVRGFATNQEGRRFLSVRFHGPSLGEDGEILVRCDPSAEFGPNYQITVKMVTATTSATLALNSQAKELVFAHSR